MQAALVAAGILLSRTLGLVRQHFIARYLGATGDFAADAFAAAFRIPNLLQNLFGEGALSASLIPVYSRLLAKGNRDDADRVASAVGSLLSLVVAVLVVLGVAGAPVLVDVIAPGFGGERRQLTVQLIRILFPGAALFVWSAWCLGILNSHRRFFLSYAAPVAWNGAMIVALIVFRERAPESLAVTLAWASVIGAALQTLVQLPTVMSVSKALRWRVANEDGNVREVIRNFVPAFVARGVVQISAYVDQVISSLLPVGAPALLLYGQTITLVPVSLFGIAISAAELPEMSGADEAQSAAKVRERLEDGLRRMSFFVIPSAIAFFVLGDVIASALYQYGRFDAEDTKFTWAMLAAASVGLMASTRGRLYSSAFYALRDTRTPLRFAIARVVLAAAVGWIVATRGPAWLGVGAMWGVAGLTLVSALAGWVEFLLLRRAMHRRVGVADVGAALIGKLWIGGVVSAAVAYGLKVGMPSLGLVGAVVVLGSFGLTYLAVTAVLGVDTARATLSRVRKFGR